MVDSEEKPDWAGLLKSFLSDAPPKPPEPFRRRKYNRDKTGCVYVIAEEGNECPCKIGWALNLYHRRHGLNIGNPRLLVIKGSVLLSRVKGEPELTYRRRGVDLEAAVHVALKARRLRGEWFDVEAEFALGVIENLMSEAVGSDSSVYGENALTLAE